jgi:phosphoribosylformylglycinamidine cyclo-ligase
MDAPKDKTGHNLAPLTYRDAGVDIDRGNRLVERIKRAARSTARPGLLAGIGGFGALFELPVDRYRKPVLVSGTDGVGTKLRLAMQTGLHDGIGVDLVAMCVNDILTLGAEPLYFLDYLATGELDEELAARVVEGIAEGCRQSGAALIGGETAEMPGMYQGSDYDLAGFCVGVVERDEIIDGTAVRPGDRILGVASSGPHANGYSLIRKVLERDPDALERPFRDASSLAEVLLAPTRIYVTAVRHILARFPGSVHGIAHITGGGLSENVPRILVPGQRAEIQCDAWTRPPVFQWLQELGQVPESEMRRTFNCGIGLALVVEAGTAGSVAEELRGANEEVSDIGRIVAASGASGVTFV